MDIDKLSESLMHAIENTTDINTLQVFVADPDGQLYEISNILFNPYKNRIYLVNDVDGVDAWDRDIAEALEKIDKEEKEADEGDRTD